MWGLLAGMSWDENSRIGESHQTPPPTSGTPVLSFGGGGRQASRIGLGRGVGCGRGGYDRARVDEPRSGITRTLVARERELGQLESLIGGVSAGAGATVVVEGPAGIGKTALVSAAAQIAAASDLQVLRALGGWLEQEHAFGVVRELLGPAVTGAHVPADLFDGAAGLAAAALGLAPAAVESQGAWGDPAAAAMHGLYWLTTRLAEARPLVLMLDDAHWADALSLRFLLYLARRLEDLPVLVLLAARPDPEPPAARDVLRQLRGQADSVVIWLEGLSAQDAEQLISQAGLPDAGPAFVAECHHACAGNPFLLVELAPGRFSTYAPPPGRRAPRGRPRPPPRTWSAP